MDELIARLNVEHYRKVLATERDPDRRELVLRLLAEEQSKLATSGDPPPADADDGDSVSHLNLRYYRRRLETETDLVIRQILMRLIAEEEARIAAPAIQRASGDE